MRAWLKETVTGFTSGKFSADEKKKMTLRRFLFILAMGVVCATTGSWALGADGVFLNFYQEEGTSNLDGSFEVAADCATAWAVLTDYDQMHHFVDSLKRSHLEEYLGRGHFLVEQEFEGGFLFVTKRVRVRLDIHETRYQTILFEDLGHQDFELYKGSWNLQPDSNKGIRIIYSLKAKQNFNEPFTGNYLKGGIQELLDSMRREILRRQALKP